MDTQKSVLEEMPQLQSGRYWKLIQGSERLYYLQIHEGKRMVGRTVRGGLVFSEPVLMQVRGAPVPWDMSDGLEPVLELARTMARADELT